MPPPVCTRCKETEAETGDLWCLGCIGWESLGRELAGHWDNKGGRVLANDLVINCTRQVRALRSLTSGLIRVSAGEPGAGEDRAPSVASKELSRSKGAYPDPRDRARREIPVPPPPPIPKEEPEETDLENEGSESEESEEETATEVAPACAPKRKASPQSSRGRDHRSSGSRPFAGGSRATEEHRDRRSGHKRHRGEDRDDKRERRSARHRGGRKHQRLGRLAENPNITVHRKAGQGLLELSSTSRGRGALERLG